MKHGYYMLWYDISRYFLWGWVISRVFYLLCGYYACTSSLYAWAFN